MDADFLTKLSHELHELGVKGGTLIPGLARVIDEKLAEKYSEGYKNGNDDMSDSLLDYYYLIPKHPKKRDKWWTKPLAFLLKFIYSKP